MEPPHFIENKLEVREFIWLLKITLLALGRPLVKLKSFNPRDCKICTHWAEMVAEVPSSSEIL